MKNTSSFFINLFYCFVLIKGISSGLGKEMTILEMFLPLIFLLIFSVGYFFFILAGFDKLISDKLYAVVNDFINKRNARRSFNYIKRQAKKTTSSEAGKGQG